MLWVAISVFSLFHPRELLVNGIAVRAPFATSGEFTLAVPGKIERQFRGRMEITFMNVALLDHFFPELTRDAL